MINHEFDVDVSFLPEDVAFAVIRNDDDKLTDCYANVTVEEVPTVLQYAVEFAYKTGIKKIGYTDNEATLEVIRMTLESLKQAKLQ